MNLAQVYDEDGRLRDDVEYHHQLLDLLGAYAARFRAILPVAPPRVRKHRVVPGSVPQRVLVVLLKAGRPLLATDVYLLMPGVPKKPISVALYEFAHVKKFCIAHGHHPELKYALTEAGVALAVTYDES